MGGAGRQAGCSSPTTMSRRVEGKGKRGMGGGRRWKRGRDLKRKSKREEKRGIPFPLLLSLSLSLFPPPPPLILSMTYKPASHHHTPFSLMRFFFSLYFFPFKTNSTMQSFTLCNTSITPHMHETRMLPPHPSPVAVYACVVATAHIKGTMSIFRAVR